MRKIKAGVCKVESCPGSLAGGSNGLCGRHYDWAWKKWTPNTQKFVSTRSGAELLEALGPYDKKKTRTSRKLTPMEVIVADRVETPTTAPVSKKAHPVAQENVVEHELRLIVDQLRAETTRLMEQAGRDSIRYTDLQRVLRESEARVEGLTDANYALREAVERANATAEAIGDENKQLKERLEMLELEEATAPRPLFVKCVDLDAQGRPRIVLSDSTSSPGAGVRANAHLIGMWVRLTK